MHHGDLLTANIWGMSHRRRRRYVPPKLNYRPLETSQYNYMTGKCRVISYTCIHTCQKTSWMDIWTWTRSSWRHMSESLARQSSANSTYICRNISINNFSEKNNNIYIGLHMNVYLNGGLTCTSRALCHSSCRKSAALFQERAHLDVSGWTPAPPWCLLSSHRLSARWAASYSHIFAPRSCFSTSRQPSGSQTRQRLYSARGHHSPPGGQRTHPQPPGLPATRNCLISQEVSSLRRSCPASISSPRNPGLSWLRCGKK